MKNKFLKKMSLLLLTIGIIFFSSVPNISAGGGVSKSKKQDLSPEMVFAFRISDHQMIYFPTIAADGGMLYFWAWNGIRFNEDFCKFSEKYKNIKNNTASARLLPDSERNEDWRTAATFGNAYTLDFLEESKDPDRSKYLLRIDKKKSLIYTVRKSGDLYLFSFYLAFVNYGQPMLIRSCFVLSSDMRSIRKLLLPIDKELLN